MAAEGEFDWVGARAGEDYRMETGRNGSFREDSGVYDRRPGEAPLDPLPRATGSPLSGRPLSGRGEATVSRANVHPPGRALSVPTHSEADAVSAAQASGMQWAMGVMKQAVPFVQKILPLLDGQFAAAVSNLLTRPHTPPAPRMDLQPIENSLTELQIQQTGLKDQIADQNASLKRVEDHLEMVREATDRNTLEQQELIEDLKAITGRLNLFALLFLGLLVVSILLNLFLFLHIQRVLP